jgi:serine/threonine-protein kinase HipA
MARRLEVWWGPDCVGVLEQDESGRLSFRYCDDWLNGAGALPISFSMPLTDQPYDDKAAHAFFGGLLPEEEKRDLVARRFGVSPQNDYALLDAIGGDCAGALTLLPPGQEPRDASEKTSYRHLAPDALERILDRLPNRPLLAGEEGVRLSLAGAQDKLPVFVADAEIALPLEDTPSSHILKPAIPRYPDTVLNEAFCLALARSAGLYAVEADIHSVKEREFLLVERYDRRREPGRAMKRLHQEDFCQALGVPSELKYQNEGGPSLADCFDLVRRATARPAGELRRLLEGVLFNALIGNNDAHAKNFALLYWPWGAALAPLYDLVSTIVYEGLSPRMAMKIGGKYEFDELYPRHWERFAKEAGLGAPQVKRKLLDYCRGLPKIAVALRGRFEDEGHHSSVIRGIVAAIETRCRQTLERYGDL